MQSINMFDLQISTLDSIMIWCSWCYCHVSAGDANHSKP